jgi:hypothetical protein
VGARARRRVGARAKQRRVYTCTSIVSRIIDAGRSLKAGLPRTSWALPIPKTLNPEPCTWAATNLVGGPGVVDGELPRLHSQSPSDRHAHTHTHSSSRELPRLHSQSPSDRHIRAHTHAHAHAHTHTHTHTRTHSSSREREGATGAEGSGTGRRQNLGFRV